MSSRPTTRKRPQLLRRMERVEVDKSKRRLSVWFADGRVAVVPVEAIERAGRPVRLNLEQVRLEGHRVILIDNTEGGIEEVPWDFVRHYCDEEFSRAEREKDELSRKTLGDRLRRLRQQAGLTQRDLAQRAGVGRSTVARIENGRIYARTDTLKRLAQGRGSTLADLIAPETDS